MLIRVALFSFLTAGLLATSAIAQDATEKKVDCNDPANKELDACLGLPVLGGAAFTGVNSIVIGAGALVLLGAAAGGSSSGTTTTSTTGTN